MRVARWEHTESCAAQRGGQARLERDVELRGGPCEVRDLLHRVRRDVVQAVSGEALPEEGARHAEADLRDRELRDTERVMEGSGRRRGAVEQLQGHVEALRVGVEVPLEERTAGGLAQDDLRVSCWMLAAGFQEGVDRVE